MFRILKTSQPLTPTAGRRRAAWLALLAVVLLVHAVVTRQVAQRMLELNLDKAMPARIEVAYVRELELSAPPAVAAAAPAAIAPSPRAAAPQRAASAPEARTKPRRKPPSEPVVAEPAPVVPDRVPEPAPLLAEPASAPPANSVATAESPAASASPVELAGPAAPAGAASGAAGGQPFEWPASTRVSYGLTGNVRGEVTGDAQVQWVRAGTRYQVHLDLTVGPAFAPVITRRMSSDGELTEDGLSPRRYDEDTKVAFRERRRLTMHFEPDAVVLANGERHARWPGVQDTASQFVHLSHLFTTRPERLRVGNTIEVPLALPRKIDRWIYDVLAEETLQTPFGPLPTFHLKPRRVVQKGGDLVAEIWFAPQLRYLPVRIRIQQDPQTFIDLMIARRPELAGP